MRGAGQHVRLDRRTAKAPQGDCTGDREQHERVVQECRRVLHRVELTREREPPGLARQRERRPVQTLRVIDERVTNESFDIAARRIAKNVRPGVAVERPAVQQSPASLARAPVLLGDWIPADVDTRVRVRALA